MTYRYDELLQAPTGEGLAKNAWHHLVITPTVYGPILDLIGYVTWESNPPQSIQVAGYAAPCWTDNGRYSGVPIVGETRPILTQFPGAAQSFHRFYAPEAEPYRDSSGFLPDDFGIVYYIEPFLPNMQWRFFGAFS
jgi:hypothetical protein